MDFTRSLAWGGGALLALVGVAVAGFGLPGLVRLGLLAALAGGVVLLRRRMPEGPERLVGVPAAGVVVGWLVLAWGLGLLSAYVLGGLVLLAAVLAGLWWAYGHLVEELDQAADAPSSTAVAPEPTPDERLDALLEEAPLEGLPFGEIEQAMGPFMGRSTVAVRLKDRGWQVSRGHWRAKVPGA